MNKIYFVESELCPRIQFYSESDRNEMALALWEEQVYFLWGAHVACFGKIFNDGWGAIIWMKWQKKPWVWKVVTK